MSVCGHAAFLLWRRFFAEAKKQEQKFLLRREERDEGGERRDTSEGEDKRGSMVKWRMVHYLFFLKKMIDKSRK